MLPWEYHLNTFYLSNLEMKCPFIIVQILVDQRAFAIQQLVH